MWTGPLVVLVAGVAMRIDDNKQRRWSRAAWGTGGAIADVMVKNVLAFVVLALLFCFGPVFSCNTAGDGPPAGYVEVSRVGRVEDSRIECSASMSQNPPLFRSVLL